MNHSQPAWKGFPYGNNRLPEPAAPFRSGSGISTLSALRFELQWGAGIKGCRAGVIPPAIK